MWNSEQKIAIPRITHVVACMCMYVDMQICICVNGLII